MLLRAFRLLLGRALGAAQDAALAKARDLGPAELGAKLLAFPAAACLRSRASVRSRRALRDLATLALRALARRGLCRECGGRVRSRWSRSSGLLYRCGWQCLRNNRDAVRFRGRGRWLLPFCRM